MFDVPLGEALKMAFINFRSICMVKIRMTRLGRKSLPIYSIVATDSRSPRDGQFLEKLGQYNPKSPETLNNINVEGIKAWLSKGAQLSDTVRTLLKKNNIKL